jgi:hypothetical protein
VDKTEIQEEGIITFYDQNADKDMPDVGEGGTTATGNKVDVESSYVHADAKTPGPKRKVSDKANPKTPAVDNRAGTPGSGKRKAAESAMEKLHNEVMPDLMAWEKEKNRKRFPMESASQAEEGEKRRKVEKRKSEEKENIVEGVQKKAKKVASAEVVREAETGPKITLLVTGADPTFLEGGVPKVCTLLKLDNRNYFDWGLKLLRRWDFAPISLHHISFAPKSFCAH